MATSKLLIKTTLSSMLLVATQANADFSHQHAGDYTQVLLPLTGLGVSLAKGDTEGTWQLTRSFVTSTVISQSIKYVAAKQRPNFAARTSFPSGHTTAAFSGASFLHTRYGSTWGVPAYAVAAYTGWSRVYSDKHYWDDVIGGASIAVLTNLFFVNPIAEDITVSPMINGDSKGLKFSFSNRFFEGGSRAKAPDTRFNPKFKFDFYMGPSQLKSSDSISYDNHDHLEVDDRITTAAVRWTYALDSRNDFSFFTQPFEIRSQGKAASGQEQYAQYQVWDNILNWSYDLAPNNAWIARAGAGLMLQYAKTAISDAAHFENFNTVGEEWLFYPMLNANIGYQFDPKWAAVLAAEYGNNGDGNVISANATVNYLFNKRWDAALGYSYYQRDQDNVKTLRRIEFDSIFLRVGYKF
ncbi:phosphatase PAP2 family protein [Alginatibacterium sediminis]|uniref:undecaprenyl-diphosphate phosphatase n=1 Tax=Alginatibacterium sediminis TaxID=2164068 RepID=A0A420EMX1_9ALTE|nr:phosphatase PAP2 family protein [Alginatibacterium sediminis]RKF22067.1 phosphatase PAP2 family protein [Alginatibacterium sediminis]